MIVYKTNSNDKKTGEKVGRKVEQLKRPNPMKFQNTHLINKYQRIQTKWTLDKAFPKIEGFCSCGCGNELTGRRTRWYSNEHRDEACAAYYLVSGHWLREETFKRDKGFCAVCGEFDEKWQADHILEVVNGGGGCGLENMQTLCLKCHKKKTREIYNPNEKPQT